MRATTIGIVVLLAGCVAGVESPDVETVSGVQSLSRGGGPRRGPPPVEARPCRSDSFFVEVPLSAEPTRSDQTLAHDTAWALATLANQAGKPWFCGAGEVTCLQEP